MVGLSRRAVAVSALAAYVVLVTAAFATPGSGSSRSATIDPNLIKALRSGHEADFWIVMEDKASLQGASAQPTWARRGDFVVDRLRSVAASTQQPILAFLRAKGAPAESFWIANVIKTHGDRVFADAVAARPGVESLLATRTYDLPKPTPAAQQATVNAVEWGIANINADDVWATYGATGQGIVVANVDTGVQYDHPALVKQYRGNLGNGTFDHNYNWWDPAHICGNPMAAPCDNDGHGTHTMGTIVGASETDRIGVAPGATWIAAKGCESSACSDASLLSAGQWILAPTNLAGTNPLPSKRPQIVNNSWSTANGTSLTFNATVQAWRAAGIFPVFANGNSGPACGTVGAPGSLAGTYGVGAYDSTNTIASFSSRGPSPLGPVKPDISAPGVAIRSSVPGNQYASLDGTSMAAPHVAGAIALLWSAAPTLAGDIDATIALLDDTAVDANDLSCGGIVDDNNVFGEGRLDILAAVAAAPRGVEGTLTGTVTASPGGVPVEGATIAVDGERPRLIRTNASGVYSVPLPPGAYALMVSAYGYLTQTVTGVAVTGDSTTTRNLVLPAAAAATISGLVRDALGRPAAGVAVEVVDTPLSTTTGLDGRYAIPGVVLGSAYDITFSPPDLCHRAATARRQVTGATTVDAVLPAVAAAGGYFCSLETPEYVDAGTVTAFTGDEVNTALPLPFSFPYYGSTYSTAYLSDNGMLNFLALPGAVWDNRRVPESGGSNAIIAPFWDDLAIDGSASVRTALLTGPSRFVIEWRNVHFYQVDLAVRVDFEVVLYEDGRILLQYRNIGTNPLERGSSITIGIENATGDSGHQYSFNTPTLNVGTTAILYHLPDTQRPVGSLAVPAYSNTTTIPVTVTGSDEGIVQGYLLTESQAVPAPDDRGWDGNPPTSFRMSAGDGPRTVRLWVRDSLGNVSEPIAPSAVLTLDTAIPTSRITMPAFTKSRTVPVKVSGSDKGSTVTGYYLSESFTPPSALSPGAGWLTAPPTSFRLSPGAGRKTVYVFTKDAAGNVSLARSAKTILDMTAPKARISGPSFTKTPQIALTISGTDANGLKGYFVGVPGKTPTAGAKGWMSRAPKTIRLPGGDGLKTVRVWTKDGAGNVSVPAALSVRLDTRAPSVTVTVPRANAILASLPKVRGTASDPAPAARLMSVGQFAIRQDSTSGDAAAGRTCRWWDAKLKKLVDAPCGRPLWRPFVVKASWTAPAGDLRTAGSYVLVIRVQDKAGNESVVDVPFTIRP